MVPAYKKEYIKNPVLVSYTSLNDFLRCPRSYYLKNIYRDPRQGYRLQITSPYLTLGATVHDTLKWYLETPTTRPSGGGKPTKDEAVAKFKNFWMKFRGKKGGFNSLEEEAQFGTRGVKMVENFIKNAYCLEPCAPTLSFPKFKLADGVLLWGNMDFVGVCPDGTLHVVDFKTGAHDEESPLQLYMYSILTEANLQKPVSKAGFWYLDRDDNPKDIVLDPLDNQIDWLRQKGLELKKAIEDNNWVCIKDPDMCRDCADYTALIDGKGEFMFSDNAFRKEVYFLDRTNLPV